MEYDPVSFRDSREILLSERTYAWIVAEGTVNVFVAERNEAGVTGRKYYIAQYTAGDILFGVQPYSESGIDIVFLCMGLNDAELARVNLKDIEKVLLNSDEKTINLLSVPMLKWIRQTEEILHDYYVPGDAWDEISTVRLSEFNQAAIEAAAHYIRAICQKETQRIRSKQVDEQNTSDASITELANIVGQRKKNSIRLSDHLELPKNVLAAACRLVADSLGIQMVLPPDTILEQSPNPLYEIVRISEVRFRQIILSGVWWKKDGGPILGFFTDKKVPVALIPIAENKYKMINPCDGTERIIDSDLAQQLQPKAYMFYRRLPVKELQLSDIIRFCTYGFMKRDIRRAILIGMIAGSLNLSVPIANAIVFNHIIPEGEKGQLLQTALLLISFGISGALFGLARSFALVRIENRAESSLQAAVWDRLISLPVPFFRKYSSGELAMRAMGFSLIRKEISGTVITGILSAVFTLLNFILLMQYSMRMSLYTLLLIFIILAFTFICGKIQLRYRNQLTRLTNQISGQIFQMIGGVARFRTAGAEKRAFHQWTKAYGKREKLNFKNSLISNCMNVFSSVFPVVALMVIFSVTFYIEKLDTGSFIAFHSAFSAIITAMLALSGILANMINIKSLYESTKPILQTVPEYDSFKEDPGELDGNIELSHITFRYQPEAPIVINDLSLKIKKGEYVAIVGPSGCGKSTILRLLLGFEKPEEGKIYYDGHDMEKVDLRSVRRQLGVVMQNSQLMTGDIRSNIMGMNPNLTMEDAVEALKLAGIYEDIKAMPMGLFTAVSEGGATLSGGQRQRLLIARVLINKPKIIFFDEATSALDNKTQAMVSKTLDSIDATRIVIAHRLSTIIHCDRILVLDKGRIVEEGSYEELMEKKSIFYELAKRQLA
jgi:ATP-binding cassette subfamily C protein